MIKKAREKMDQQGSRVRDYESGLPPPSQDKYTQLFLTIVANGHRFEFPVYIGDRRQERLKTILDYVLQQGAKGVSADEVKKFVMRKFWISHKTAAQDLRDLVFTDRLSRKGDLFFHPDGDEFEQA